MAAPPAPMRQFAAAIADLRRRLDRVERGQRTTQLDHSSIEDAGLPIRDGQQQVRQIVGRQVDGTFAVTHHHGDPPPQPSPPVVYARELALVVSHDGGFADAAAPADLARFDVHIADLNIQGLAPDADTLYGSIPATGGTVCATVDNQPHYIQVVAVSASGQRSAASEVVEAAPLAASNVEFGVVGAEQLQAVLNLASRIVAGDPNGSRVELNGQGFAAYNADGTPTVSIDSNTGNTVIRGEIRTADTGSRIIWNPATTVGDSGEIRFYTSAGDANSVGLFASQWPEGTAFIVRGSEDPSSGFRPDLAISYDNEAPDKAHIFLGGRNRDGVTTCGVSAVPSDRQIQIHCDLDAYSADTWYSLIDATPSYCNLKMRNPTSGGQVYVAGVEVADDAEPIGSGTGVRTQVFGYPALMVYNQTGTAWSPVQAAEFKVQSSRSTKHNISPAPSSPLAAVRGAPASEWTYISDDDNTRHFGPMAEDLPGWLHREGGPLYPPTTDDGEVPTIPTVAPTAAVGVASMMGALWEALRELDTELDELRDAARPRITKPHRKARDE